MMRMGSPYAGWMMAAVGLLGLTYGLDRVFDEERQTSDWAVTALAAPLAIAGLTRWTMSLARDARH